MFCIVFFQQVYVQVYVLMSVKVFWLQEFISCRHISWCMRTQVHVS